MIPVGRIDLAIAPDGTGRIAFAGPETSPGVYLAASNDAGGWQVQRLTKDKGDADPSVVVADGQT